MKIVSVDAPVGLVKKLTHLNVPDFIMDVVRPLEADYFNHFCHQPQFCSCQYQPNVSLPTAPIRKFEEYGYENIAFLLHTVPIYLRDSRAEKIREEDCIVDLLGAYFSNRASNSNNPYIELYLSPINDSTINDKHFKWLFTKVLIHELAHAALDIFNWERHNNADEKVSYQSDFGKWREESMANAIALRIIRDSSKKDFYNYAKKFMRSQPDEYALGVLMEDFGYWDFKSVFDSKIYGVDGQLQEEWLDYAKNEHKRRRKGLHDWNNKILENLVK